MELRAKYTVFGEGARGSLTKTLIERFGLNRNSDHQKYGLGVKELWQLAPNKFEPGLVQHTMGWPLPNKAGGGSWLYHFDDHLLSVGFVTHLNYENPTLSPFEEFQRFKTHPMIAETFEGPSASATAPARSWRAAGNRCPSSSSPAAASSAIPPAS